jgi:hypothetical protein
MNKLTFLLASLLVGGVVQAGEAKVNFKDFKEYQDVRSGKETRGSYHKRIAEQLEKHIAKLAQRLPEGYHLNLTFNDIDLAGDVRFNMDDIRVVKPIYFPRFNLTYTLKDRSGQILLEEKSKQIKDMSFMDRMKRGIDESFYYEKRLLTDWFEDELIKKVD